MDAATPPAIRELLAQSVVVATRFGSVFAESRSSVLFLRRRGTIFAFVFGIVGGNVGLGGVCSGSIMLLVRHDPSKNLDLGGYELLLYIGMIVVGALIGGAALWGVIVTFVRELTASQCKPLLIFDCEAGIMRDATGNPLCSLATVVFVRGYPLLPFGPDNMLALDVTWPGGRRCVFQGSSRDLVSNPLVHICNRLRARGFVVQ